MMPTKMWVIGIGALGLLFVIYLGYKHYTGLVEDNKRLEKDVSTYQMALDTQKVANQQSLDVIEEWKQHGDLLASSLQEMQEVTGVALEESRRLNDIFSKHDLAALSLAKPGLVELRINRGVDRVNRMFRCETSEGGCSNTELGSTSTSVSSAKSRANKDVGSEVGGGDP